MAFVFTPNHMGMPINIDIHTSNLKSQIGCTRNIKGNILHDFIFGGLNYQIEHHIFPAMPRSNFRKITVATKQFCSTFGYKYHETGILAAYKEIFSYLYEAGSSIRVNAA